jgi:hypothetical protein
MTHPMTRVIARLFVLAACASACLSSCSTDTPAHATVVPPSPSATGSGSSSPTPVSEAGWSSYTDPAGTFVVSYPSGWTVTDHSAGSTAAVGFTPPDGGLVMGVSVIPREVVLGNFSTTREWITGLGRSVGPSVESGPVRLLGLPGYRAVNQVSSPNGPPVLVESIGALGDGVGVLTFVNRSPDDRAAVDRFARMVDSLQVTGVSSA